MPCRNSDVIRNGDVDNYITEHYLKKNIKPIGTLPHEFCILKTTINDSLSKAGLLT